MMNDDVDDINIIILLPLCGVRVILMLLMTSQSSLNILLLYFFSVFSARTPLEDINIIYGRGGFYGSQIVRIFK